MGRSSDAERAQVKRPGSHKGFDVPPVPRPRVAGIGDVPEMKETLRCDAHTHPNFVVALSL